jgi:hypothetical protein
MGDADGVGVAFGKRRVEVVPVTTLLTEITKSFMVKSSAVTLIVITWEVVVVSTATVAAVFGNKVRPFKVIVANSLASVAVTERSVTAEETDTE